MITLEQFRSAFEAEAVKLMRDNKVPGMSVLITKGGKVFYERAFGAREWEGHKPATPDTIYGIASMTKSMTSLAILQLQERGKLNVQDPISKHIPVDLGEDITIHDLMCHGSGIPSLKDYVFPITNEDLAIADYPKFPMGNWEDFYFHVNDAKDWVMYPPGKKFYYFNGGYTMLGKIVEKASGMGYEEYVKKNILDVLGMERSTFYREDLDEMEDVSKGYAYKPEGESFSRIPKPHTTGPFNSSAGGLNSTVRDLTKYLRMHLDKGTYEGKRLLSEELISEMYKPHNTNIKGVANLLVPGKRAYGYGFGVYDFFGHTLITHGGASGVSGGQVAFIPELDLTFTWLYNVFGMPSHLMYYALYLLVGKNPDKEMPFIRRRKHFNKLMGKYSIYRNINSAEIVSREGLLQIKQTFNGKTVLTPLIPVNEDVEPWEFRAYGPYGYLDVEFTEHENGEITFDYERDLFRKQEYRKDYSYQ